jgi:hypothetical protein
MTTRRHHVPLHLGILLPIDASHRTARRISEQRPQAREAVANAVYQDRVTAMMAGWCRATARYA